MTIIPLVVISIVLVLVIGVTIYLSVFVVHVQGKPRAPTPPPVTFTEPPESKPVLPPCFDLSSDAKAIFGIFAHDNKIREGQSLMDVVSILLCLSSSCTTEKLKERTVQLLGLGADKDDPVSIQKTRAFIKFDRDTDASIFLVMATYMMDKRMRQLKEAETLPLPTLKEIDGYLYSLCSRMYPKVWSACTSV